MLISLKILKKYIDIPKNISSADIALKLTEKVVEVESVFDEAAELQNIFVGQIKKICKHPNADKLKLVDISLNKKKVRVVCGGTNLKEGMLIAVALPGANVRWHGEGDLVALKKAEIRGEKSAGMICAADEIGLQNMFCHDIGEIADLSNFNLKVGSMLSDAFGLDDTVLNIDNKSLTNRPDIWSHWGMARVLAVIFGLELKEPKLFGKSTIKKNGDIHIEIEDHKLCPRYLGCVIKNLKVEESPVWLKKALTSMGQKSINNIVDITNFVMFELGEPLHAFDKDKINNIVVRRARNGESLVTLDEVLRKLDQNDLVVADSRGPLALAGLKGGLGSGVTEKTKNIVLEAANFDALTIRRMTMRHGFRTEGSNRWEKGLHPNLAEIGMLRALQLISEICPSAKISPIIAENKKIDGKQIIVETSSEFIQGRIGKKIPEKEIISILSKLGFKIKIENLNNSKFKLKTSKLFFEVPWWRSTGDISIPEDIVEEVARVYGYDNMDVGTELVNFEEAKYQPAYGLENEIKNYLSVGAGMNEVFNYPWADYKILVNLQAMDEKYIQLENPPTENNKFLKTSLVPGLIKNVEDNLRFSSVFRIFEMSQVFMPMNEKFDGEDILPKQPKMLGGAVVEDKKTDVFHEIKGILEEFLIFNFKLPNIFQSNNFKFLNPDKSLIIYIGKEEIGWLGELKDEYYCRFDFNKKKVAFFEIDFSKFCEIKLKEEEAKKYIPVPKFPVIERDLAIEIDYNVKWRDVAEMIMSKERDMVVKAINFLSVFDLQSKKSLAFRITYGLAERTLTDDEAISVEKNILKKLRNKFGAELRGKHNVF